MSGHSHFATIKRKKEASDQKRGKVFSKLSREIALAAKEGPNPESNSKLRFTLDKAKQFNMPKENIERAIKKGTGELEGEKLEEFIFEALGPSNTALIIEGITDNKNRTLGEIKGILNQYNAKLANEGSVKWMFERKGLINLDPKEQEEKFQNGENLELAAIEAGADDVSLGNDTIEIYTRPEELEAVKKALESKGIRIGSATLGWKEKDTIEIPDSAKETLQKIFESLDENDAVQEIYSNASL